MSKTCHITTFSVMCNTPMISTTERQCNMDKFGNGDGIVYNLDYGDVTEPVAGPKQYYVTRHWFISHKYNDFELHARTARLTVRHMSWSPRPVSPFNFRFSLTSKREREFSLMFLVLYRPKLSCSAP